MENIIDKIMSFEFGFYLLVGIDLLYIILREGRLLFTHLASKTKTTKDDEIVAKIYEVLDKYKVTIKKASDEIQKNKKKKEDKQ